MNQFSPLLYRLGVRYYRIKYTTMCGNYASYYTENVRGRRRARRILLDVMTSGLNRKVQVSQVWPERRTWREMKGGESA
jgi:hypothetical protein